MKNPILLFVFICTTFISAVSFAQPSFECNYLSDLIPDLNNVLVINKSDLLESNHLPNEDLVIKVYHPNGSLIAEGTNEVTITNTDQYVGIYLRDTIIYPVSGEFCIGQIWIRPSTGFGCNGKDLVLTPDANDEIRITPSMVLDSFSNLNRSYGLEIFETGRISPGNGIVSGIDEVILINSSQYSGTLVIRIHDVITGDKCTKFFMNLNPQGGLDCPPTVEVIPDNDCNVSFPPRYFTSDSLNGNVNFGAILDPNGNPIWLYSDWIGGNVSNFDDNQLTGLAIDASNGDHCYTQIIINDTIPPVPYCHHAVVYYVAAGNQQSIIPASIGEWSYDNCGDITMKVFQVDSMRNPILPFSNEILLPSTTMTHVIGLEVTDIQGNTDYCLADVVIKEVSAQLLCNVHIQYSVGDDCEVIFEPDQILEGFFNPSIHQIDLFDTNGDLLATGLDAVLFPDANMYFLDSLTIQISDTQTGETCSSTIVIEDKLDPTPICIVDTAWVNPVLPLTITANDIDIGSYDNCSLASIQIAHFDQGIIGSLANSLAITENVDSSYLIALVATDESGNEAYCITSIIVDVPDPLSTNIKGNIFEDLNGNCTMDAGEPGTGTWNIVSVSYPSNTSKLIQADANGAYDIDHQYPQTDTMMKVFLLTPMNLTQHCPNTFCFDLTTVGNSVSADFAIQTTRLISTPCPQLVVDVSTSHLTRCQNSTYTINYCNYGNEVANDGKVVVTFDSDLKVIGSDLPWSSSNANTYTFDLGSVQKGDCGVFKVEVEVSCTATLGESHPVVAEISPNQHCEDIDPNWIGASVKVDGECKGDSIVFTITNVGKEDMIQALNYIVIEDVILHKSGSFDLLEAAQLRFSAHGKGNTCRLEAEQVPGHPGNSFPSVTIEGCGVKQDGTTSLGYYKQFPPDDADVFRSIHVRENEDLINQIELVAFPSGVDSRHFIKPNRDIEYMIRVPNNGIAAISDMEVTIDLPEELDFASLIPGASSNLYRFEISESGEVKFIFENIVIEPSNWIFVKYRVSQKPDLPNGTMILNEAKITFNNDDFSFTNQTFHEVSDNFLTFSKVVNLMDNVEFKIAPNPFVESTIFTLEGIDIQRFTLTVFDNNGKLIRKESFSDLTYEFQRNGLTKGIYFFNIQNENGVPIVSGKLNPID